MKFNHPLFLLFITCLPFVIRAQTAPPEAELYKFRVIGWNRNHADMFYLLDGEPQTVRLLKGVTSQLQQIPGPEKLIFYVPGKGEEGTEPQAYPLAKVALNPPPAQNLIVIWMNQQGRYQSAVLKDDPDNPGPGKLRIVNFSGNDLRIQSNKDQILRLAPGASEVMIPENEGVGLKVAYRNAPDETWEIGLMNGITVRQTDRVTAFIADPSKIAPTLEEISTKADKNTQPLTLFVIRN